MAQEAYKVMNVTRGPVGFEVYPQQNADELAAMPGHKRRKAIRSASRNIVIPHGHSMDLVEETGMSIEDLKRNVDLHRLIQRGKLQILEVKLEEKIKEPKELEVEKPKALEELEATEEVPDESKKSKKTSKKKKK